MAMKTIKKRLRAIEEDLCVAFYNSGDFLSIVFN